MVRSPLRWEAHIPHGLGAMGITSMMWASELEPPETVQDLPRRKIKQTAQYGEMLRPVAAGSGGDKASGRGFGQIRLKIISGKRTWSSSPARVASSHDTHTVRSLNDDADGWGVRVFSTPQFRSQRGEPGVERR